MSIVSSEHITVCVCTFKRLELLRRLLLLLSKQETINGFTFSVIVVDNDEFKSAEIIIDEAKHNYDFKIDYYVEPVQNISMARNKSIKYSYSKYIAFIDDDELPPSYWLNTLYSEIKRSNVDGVLGPVIPYFETKPSKWLVKGKFYEKKPKFKTGYALKYYETRTSNALIHSNILDEIQIPFDPRYGRGGEDRDFFKRLISRGHTFTWVRDAHVYESVPYERTKRIFMCKRALLRGKVSASNKENNTTIFKSFIAFFIYSVIIIPALFLGQDIFMKICIKLCEHLGKVMGVFRIKIIKEYYVM
jgi:glycosyltransferase involved in cell wall biosynthesis